MVEPVDTVEPSSAVGERRVSHETSFFRHEPSFDALRTIILPGLRRRPLASAVPVSVCSAGCSTGQEAYSLAMTVMTALEDDDGAVGFAVWGFDSSRAAIETARAGCYSAKAVSTLPAYYRQRFLRPVAGDSRRFEFVEPLRSRVRFIAADIFAPGAAVLTYDVVFCQNVLIYFAAAAVPRLLAALADRLAIGGYLILAPGEAPLVCPDTLEPLTLAGVRVFRRVARSARKASA